MKKAQGIQFNWIFVIISGAIILAFFSVFIVKYQDLQETRISAKIARNIDASISSLKTNNVYTNLDLTANFNFKKNCNSFIINNNYEQDLDNKIVFAEDFEDRKILVWVKEFKFPYKVDNLLFISNPKINYYFVGDNELSQDIYDEFPDIFNKDKISISEVASKDDKNSKFIFFDQDIEVVKGKSIKIDQDNKIVRIRTTNLPYLNEEMLLGAIFSSDIEDYECNFDKTLDKLKLISTIYAEKSRQLNTLTSCSYIPIINNLRRVNNLISDENYLGLIENKDRLERQNRQVLNTGCSVVF